MGDTSYVSFWVELSMLNVILGSIRVTRAAVSGGGEKIRGWLPFGPCTAYGVSSAILRFGSFDQDSDSLHQSSLHVQLLFRSAAVFGGGRHGSGIDDRE